MTVNDIIPLIKESVAEWSEDKASRLAASLAYYTVFSIPPLLIITLAIAGQVFDAQDAQARLVNQISGLVGADGAEAIEAMIENADQPGETILATLISVAVLLFGASGVFGQLQDALNTMWEVAPKPGRGILGTLKDRFFSFTMVLGIAFLLLVSLIVSSGLAALDEFVRGMLPGMDLLLQILSHVISFAVTAALFALIFKIVPDVEVAWKDVWIGAVVTAALFEVGKFAIGYYLGNSAPASTYGAAGSLVVILLWVYYSAQILFFGAEFTQVYANKLGSRIVADEDAVALSEEARTEQGIPRDEDVAAAARSGRSVEAEAGRGGSGRLPAGARAITASGHTYQTGPDTSRAEYYTVAVLALLIGFWRWLRS